MNPVFRSLSSQLDALPLAAILIISDSLFTVSSESSEGIVTSRTMDSFLSLERQLKCIRYVVFTNLLGTTSTCD